MKDRDVQQRKMKEHLSAISHADSIEEIFVLLNLYIWNYLNYHLLQHILKAYGDNETNRMMQDYVIAVDAFKRTTSLREFWSIQSKRRCPEVPDTLRLELKKVVCTHRKLTLESTLAEVEYFRRDLAQQYSLPEFTTIIVGIDVGSVTTVWLMSLSAVTVLQEKIEEGDLNFLHAHEITRLKVDGETVYSEGVLILQMFGFALVPNIYKRSK